MFGLVPEIYHKEGYGAFYKGFWANFMRIGGFNVAMFVCLEQVIRFYDRLYVNTDTYSNTINVKVTEDLNKTGSVSAQKVS